MLAVIDGATPAMVAQTVAAGRAPTLAALIERGSFVSDAVSVFPSVTPVCAASIATGFGQDRHHIPGMNWYHRDERRYVEYGSSFRASLRFGLARQLTDTIYNMNGEHLAADTLTVFEQLDDVDLRTAGTTYLMYRGRHRHEPARETLLTRIAARSLVRRSVLGPRELFYADIFASRATGCYGTLGLPGVRDRHAGCVGAYLVKHDLFDFLLLSLPDNDNHSHRNGPDGQIDSLPEADRQLALMFAAGGGTDRFLAAHAVIVVADHAHTLVAQSISLVAHFTGHLDIRLPTDLRAPGQAEVALCPNSRAAMIYALEPRVLGAAIDRARRLDGVEHVIWRDGADAVIAGNGGELRFAPGTDAGPRDPRGRHWDVRGELGVLDARVEGSVIHSERYPDALGRTWDALNCPTSGDILLSAAGGYEFADWGGASHVGGGSHGSLAAGDSLAPLICCGVDGGVERDQWSIKDVKSLVARHFGLRWR
ncbi:MAG TPA: alkaline phosphatase family protein [Solirubrobacteraceae bacterium]|nr:alkaline phosphatase family protein [Solirubrobacteraceae bacterium]